MNVDIDDYKLSNLESINVIIGKNGCGKSTLLRLFDSIKSGGAYVRYVTPERGGVLKADGNIETNISNNPNWEYSVRRSNRFDQYKQIVVAEFRKLEILVLRSIESEPEFRNNAEFTFQSEIDKINALLDNIKILRSENGLFDIADNETGHIRGADSISSGESELITLAIGILSISYVSRTDKYKETENWLILDEPDVHLHPDLQGRLMALLRSAQEAGNFRILLATHSTSIVSSLRDGGAVEVAFMRRGQKNLEFCPVDEALAAVLPIFGAHPLSNVFNQMPILLVEGEDDERIWQQAVRSSNGRIRAWPCVAGDIQSLQRYELRARDIIEAVYDNGRAFSLRDRDDGPYDIDDLGPVRRARLNCYAAENLLLTDDVLSSLETDWPTLRGALEDWLDKFPAHPRSGDVARFRADGWNRRDSRIKTLRNLILGVLGTEKPWEVVVGQAIAAVATRAEVDRGEFSLLDFLGPKLVQVMELTPT
jgi:energy-coupling factor transporter ATP-binding protein EcfA2